MNRSRGAAPPALAFVLAVIAALYALYGALTKAWLCDDAFISFRYAENLVGGLGLVYNAGERVEGYTNFLWTVWVALGMRLGAPPEIWAAAWGVAFYIATLALLFWNYARRRAACAAASGGHPARAVSANRSAAAGGAFPVACLLVAVHPDAQVYATSGLEPALFTFLAVLGFVLAVDPGLGVRGVAGAGLALGLTALTRPDGVLFAALVGIFVLARRRPRVRSSLVFAGLFALAWLPHLVWRLSYYGDFFPNPYYAKSAAIAWYEQGWLYARLYFQKYWVLAAALPLAALAFGALRGVRHRGAGARPLGAEAVLAAALALAYTAYVIRVGGDFMYARLLIPVTPFFSILVELVIARIGGPRAVQGLAAAAALVLVVRTPVPLRGKEPIGGIVNEHLYYPIEVTDDARNQGLVLRRYFEGLEARVAYVGSQATLVYYARPAFAIESETGLTDRWIARRPLARRGRVGHEKVAPPEYLIDQRRVHFVIQDFAGVMLGLDSVIPRVPIAFDNVPGRIVHWDSELLAEIRRRGAEFDDFSEQLDRYLQRMDGLPAATVRADYARFRRFYFQFVPDSARAARFLRWLEARARPGNEG